MDGAGSGMASVAGTDAAVFRYSRGKQRQGMIGVAIAGLGAFGFAAVVDEPILRWGCVALGAATLAIAAFYLLRPFDPAAYADHTLTIDRDGISCPVLFTAKVPWSGIASAGVTTDTENTDRFVMAVVDPSAHPPSGSRVRRVTSFLESGSGASLDLSDMEGSGKDVKAALERFRPPAA